MATGAKTFERLINQARMSSERNGPIYKFGVRVPRHKGDARKLDAENGDTKWHDAEQAEMTQLFEYEVFEDYGVKKAKPPGYTFIRVHFVYDCKHDLRRKARMVAGGHMTIPSSVTDGSGHLGI